MNKTDFSFDFSNKISFVLGGSRGIGKCLVQQLRKYSSEVYYTYNTTNDENEHKYKFHYDASNPEDILEIYKEMYEKKIIPDFVINCLGIGSSDKISDIDSEKWRKMMKINVESYFLSCKEAVKLMKKYKKSGRIINISSIAGRNKSRTAGTDYTASKYAIIGLTKQLAHECDPKITINVVCPSHTRTDMMKLTNKQISNLEKNIPMNRIAKPIDIVKPILFLCSSLSSYMTGCCLDVNGGQF